MGQRKYWQTILASTTDEPFKHAAREFLWECERNRLSPKSIDGYGYGLESFRLWLQSKGILFPAIDRNVIRLYFAELNHKTYSNGKATKPLSQATIHSHFRSLRAWFRFLESIELWKDKNPLTGLRVEGADRRVPDRLSKDQMDLLRQIPNKGKLNGLRTYLMISLLWEGALRVGELIGLRVQDIDLNSGYYTVDGKTGKRTLPLPNDLKSPIGRYITKRKLQPHDYLFATRNGTAINERNVRHSLNRVLEQAKRKKGQADFKPDFKIYPHGIRHSALTFLAGRMDPFMLQYFAGHSSPTTTQIYLHFDRSDRERIKLAFERAHAEAVNGR